MAYTTITSEGNVLPTDILDAIAAGEIGGQHAADFGLERSARLSDEIATAWGDARVYWDAFQRTLRRLRTRDTATSETRDRWIIPLLETLGYRDITYQPTAAVIDERTYAISHRAGHDEDALPIHIESVKSELDTRPPTGRPRLSPHELVQSYLNNTEHLWSIVTNGNKLRLLRDTSRITRPSYVEFDLRAMFDDEVFNEFHVLYRVIHRSRFPETPADAPTCWLERYYQQAIEQGGRVRDGLRDGVERALRRLGNGFLHHPANKNLRQQISAGSLTPLDYYRQLLRLVYRLLFLMVAEDRRLIAATADEAHDSPDSASPTTTTDQPDPWLDQAVITTTGAVVPPATPDTLCIYYDYYSVGHLRRLAEHRNAGEGPYDDLWIGLSVTFRLLEGSDEASARALGITALDGDLFGDDALRNLHTARIRNADLLGAVYALSLYRDPQTKYLRRVNYGALDVEELGSVYESLLDYRPVISGKREQGRGDREEGRGKREQGVGSREQGLGIWEQGQWSGIYPTFALVAGTERKTTGSYYTRPELVQELIKSTLDPIIDARLQTATAQTPTQSPARSPDRSSVSPCLRGEAALLSIRVCDPACGSGHFLLAAARRIGRALAKVRSGEDQPTPSQFRRAVRDVIAHCIYGVDVNPLAVDLCKLALWIEGHNAGMPLSFLDSHIRVGNSLIGASADLVAQGIPDDAFKAVSGDDKQIAAALRKRNKQERQSEAAGQMQLDLDTAASPATAALADGLRDLDATPDSSVATIRAKASRYYALRDQARHEFMRYDMWCAAFFQPFTAANQPTAITTRLLYEHQRTPLPFDHPAALAAFQLANEPELRFFHWELEFPQVFATHTEPDTISRKAAKPQRPDKEPDIEHIHGPIYTDEHRGDGSMSGSMSGSPCLRVSVVNPGAVNPAGPGFDVVLGNPPWERIKLQEQEHFVDVPEICKAANKAARERVIKAWRTSDDPAKRQRIAAFDRAKHRADATSRFIRTSGSFPLTAVGDMNTYALFAELDRNLVNAAGRAGIIVPTGIATDDTTKAFFGDLVQTHQLHSLYDFENREKLFADVDSRYRFSLMSLRHTHTRDPIRFVFFASNVAHLQDEQRTFSLTPDEIALINPNTRTCPTFRTQADAALTKAIYRRVPVLINERTGKNPWGVSFMAMLHMANDSHLFHTEAGEGMLPLYEAKLMHQFSHRWATYEQNESRDLTTDELRDPHHAITPRYWVSHTEVDARLAGKWEHEWLLGWRDVTNATNERTAIFSLLPRVGVGHKVQLIFFNIDSPARIACFFACINSLVLDFVARQKIGGMSLSYFILKQLPVLPPSAFSDDDIAYIVPRVLELVYTAWDMRPFAEDVLREQGAGNGEIVVPAPYVWDEERRAIVRAELDARIARLYGITRDELRYILDPADVHGEEFPGETFRVLKEKEQRLYGEYRTQRLVLAAWDAGQFPATDETKFG